MADCELTEITCILGVTKAQCSAWDILESKLAKLMLYKVTLL